MILITLAGMPATIEYGPTSFVTTVSAATIEPSPIVTPAKIVACAPINTSSFIMIG